MDKQSRPDITSSQQPVIHRSVYPTNNFVEFSKAEVEQSIHSRFEEQVDKYPNKLAVKTGNCELSYSALNGFANRIARAIMAQRGEKNEPIALVFERGASVIAAILGVLKTGKIYMALEPEAPETRLAQILKDSQTKLVVTNDRNLSLGRRLAQDGLQLINIDEFEHTFSSENLDLSISPDTIACLLYTSGSTGQPKGVVHSHRNVLHFIMNYTNGFHICADDRLSLLYSCSFSGSITDIFSALLNGVSLFPFDIKKEGMESLANWLNQHGITIYHSPPTVFRHLFNMPTGGRFPSLRLIDIAGEPVRKSDVDLYIKHLSEDCIFVNRYGSTETTTVCWHFIDKETQINGSNVPVGYPVKDHEILLLDDGGKEVAPGEIGEITVRSRYISPGYWHGLGHIEAVSMPDPEGGGLRIYHTGDLGFIMPDGCLTQMGRKDSQVKIRGYRIGVAEIEMALLALDTIKESVVIAQETPRGEQRLVAYLVLVVQPAPNVNELRRALRWTLPDYMIPSTFLILDDLPLTANGKLDRQALPTAVTVRAELETPYASPRTPVEEILVELWEEVLYLERVGIYDNFFDLGGHSLLATQIISRVLRIFRVKMPLRSLFASPTIADMSMVIAQMGAEKMKKEDVEQILTQFKALSDGEVQKFIAELNDY